VGLVPPVLQKLQRLGDAVEHGDLPRRLLCGSDDQS
jgi:hypothetical protein